MPQRYTTADYDVEDMDGEESHVEGGESSTGDEVGENNMRLDGGEQERRQILGRNRNKEDGGEREAASSIQHRIRQQQRMLVKGEGCTKRPE